MSSTVRSKMASLFGSTVPSSQHSIFGTANTSTPSFIFGGTSTNTPSTSQAFPSVAPAANSSQAFQNVAPAANTNQAFPNVAPAANTNQRSESEYNLTNVITLLTDIKKSLTEQSPNSKNDCIHNFSCDNCKVHRISGTRYKCFICEDYDLCSHCERHKFSIHNNAHVFVKIDHPCQLIEYNE